MCVIYTFIDKYVCVIYTIRKCILLLQHISFFFFTLCNDNFFWMYYVCINRTLFTTPYNTVPIIPYNTAIIQTRKPRHHTLNYPQYRHITPAPSPALAPTPVAAAPPCLCCQARPHFWLLFASSAGCRATRCCGCHGYMHCR